MQYFQNHFGNFCGYTTMQKNDKVLYFVFYSDEKSFWAMWVKFCERGPFFFFNKILLNAYIQEKNFSTSHNPDHYSIRMFQKKEVISCNTCKEALKSVGCCEGHSFQVNAIKTHNTMKRTSFGNSLILFAHSANWATQNHSNLSFSKKKKLLLKRFLLLRPQQRPQWPREMAQLNEKKTTAPENLSVTDFFISRIHFTGPLCFKSAPSKDAFLRKLKKQE